MPDFVLEIGVEEVPASAMVPALAQLREILGELLRRERIAFDEVRTQGTPRRLAALACGVVGRQADAVIDIPGPPANRAFDAAGNPTQVAEGFARKNGLAVADLQVKPTPRGDYVFGVRREEGRPSIEVLSAALPPLFTELTFPKFMRWGEGRYRFVRPIRWILCLLDEEVVPFTIEKVNSGRETWGHRTLAAGPHPVRTAAEYPEVARRAAIILDPAEREEIITRLGNRLAAPEGLRIVWDPELLQEVVFVVEHPLPFLGGFAAEYLRLPRPVLVSAMRKHQRYFTVEDQAGNLAPYFLAVRNGGMEGMDLVRNGNERTLAFRFNDAVFYFEEDRKTTLGEKRERLKRIIFLEKLGTLFDKAERLDEGVLALCQELGWEAERAHAQRAAELCKADLASQMVVELPELQGVMGREYALLEGEAPAVAAAIGEHYRPRGAGDAPPASRLGQILSLVDRMDTLAATFSAGMIPSGSYDPFGLRRQAAGVIAVLQALPDDVTVSALVDRAVAILHGALPPDAGQLRPAVEVREALLSFLRGRLEAFLADGGVRPDLTAAALAAGWERVPSASHRARFLQRKSQEDAASFERVVTVATRVRNIVRPAPEMEGDLARLEHPTETALAIAVETETRLGPAAAAGDWDEVWRRWDDLRPAIDRFFVDVLVMAEDPTLRAARLTLLRRLDTCFLSLADFSKVVVA